MTVPRVIACGHFYANPVIPELHHCQTALGRLPVNEDPILYRPLRRSLNDPPNLLVVETHGTCELRLHASGQWTEENDFGINISPNRVRDFFSIALDGCVNDENQGGFVIEELTNVCNWLVAPDTEFPGEPPRRPGGPRNLRIPRSVTMLTAMIWNPRTNAGQFEPGANDPSTASALSFFVKGTSEILRRESPHAAFPDELDHRRAFLDSMVEKQASMRPPYWTWWGDQRRGRLEETVVHGDTGLALVNATGVPVINDTSITSPGLEIFGAEGCTASANELCNGTSRRRKRKQKRSVFFEV